MPSPNQFWTHLTGLVALLIFASPAPLIAAGIDAGGVEFFEAKIRPLLAEHCYKCHSKGEGRKIKGGLSLDSRDGWTTGGENGPAIIPGDPEKSLLIKAVRYKDESLQMPPKGEKLTDEQVRHLEMWVKMGAPDPRSGTSTTPSAAGSSEAASRHWAFQPVHMPALPPVHNLRWVESTMDHFVLAKLEQNKLAPSPSADRRTLIRRVTLDLTGLPPTPGEVSDFMADHSAGAWARVVDRLLGSPRYGERWGRHWLDVARYADTKGYVFEEERRYPFAYTYRDYVIRSFNEDLPYNRFIVEQIAADLLPLGEDKRPLAAMGFLTLGRRFLNNAQDIIDDRIDVVMRGTMGLTVVCARCHDHKYDPIPTRDYYSLYGVFASSSEPGEKPLLGTASQPRAYPEYVAERANRLKQLDDFRSGKLDEARKRARQRAHDYLLATHDGARLADRKKAESLVRERKLEPTIAMRWVSSLEKWKTGGNPVFSPWFAFSEVAEAEFASKSATIVADLAKSGAAKVNPLVLKALQAGPPASMKDLAGVYEKLFAQALESDPAAEKNARAAPDSDLIQLAPIREILLGADSPANPPREELERTFATPDSQKVRALQRAVDELDATHPGVPPRAMVLRDNPTPTTPHVLLRGSPGNPGPEVPRQFLEVIAGPHRQPFHNGSGRLEMAEAIGSPSNPLTARVLVNRVWLHHFGQGLVRTPSDFGVRADPPTHPELLDFLASRFIESGWSLKKLHREILLSATWQQRSDERPDCARVDPSNQLLWRMNRQRLDFEALRDSLLAVSGGLDLSMAGQAVNIVGEPTAPRRTIYGFIDRQNLPGLFRTFDFANPDTSNSQRFQTTVPQQALFMMNSPFMGEQALHIVRSDAFKSLTRDEDRLRLLYGQLFQRQPAGDESAWAREFLKSQAALSPGLGFQPGWHYGFGEFDPEARCLKNFTPLRHYTGGAWQGGSLLPDPAVGWVLLTPTGGHPGNDLQHSAVRRWIAPRAGKVRITGILKHEVDQGDGVRGWVIAPQARVLAEGKVRNAQHEMNPELLEVREGDAIDFVVDLNGSVEHDTYAWAPRIQYTGSDGKARSRRTADPDGDWDAQADFGKMGREQVRPAGPWEKLAQVLLLSNEFAFVD